VAPGGGAIYVGLAATPDGRNLLIIGQQSVTETRLAPNGTPGSPVALPRWGQPDSGFAGLPNGLRMDVEASMRDMGKLGCV
jgi:hypothetical protein